ncbi:LCP family protein [Mycolicibacterium boenickei]|uniref:LCP family protein n=1 Tax=Mycolicibacterium boenickei TaxID=146017 RepID=A0AAX2ZX97_9MYCO|nr:LytR family transcriptional regulator [Mycolicibacterium boenickei]UNB99974.1 LCP family protein [Mycolicibacterium boenickei]
MNAPTHAASTARHRMPRRGVQVARRVSVGLVAATVLAGTGAGWVSYHGALDGITTSNALEGGPVSSGDTENILIMGLDSRLDQHGNPLPQDVYEALHAGDETVGGYNANVLIVVHLPGNGGPATAFSIPRDDYVELAGCDVKPCKGKVKQAYGWAYQREMESLEASSENTALNEQQAREAGRRAQIATVRNLLGIPIDHFVEVTLGAFFQIAKAVAPITVCLNADTADPYSGADFHQGVQQIDAAQAMAFVRQRRDINDENFTDLDRTRRQQAFIAALVSALGKSGALSSPTMLRDLLNVTKQNVALDSGFDLASFASRASALTGAPPTLYTLPIKEFGQNSLGEDINIVDIPTIRAIVHDLVAEPGSNTNAPAAPTHVLEGHGAVLDVVNASTYSGLAAQLETTFSANGFTPGQIGDAESLAAVSTIDYGTGAEAAAQSLADKLGVIATPSSEVAAGTVQLTLGTDFPGDEYLTGSTESSSEGSSDSASDSTWDSSSETTEETTASTPVTTVAATATGTKSAAPTDLSQMKVSGVPCVK